MARSCASMSQIHISNSPRAAHVKKPKAPPPLFSQGAGSAGGFHPLIHEGECSLAKARGAERRKARVTIHALRRTPVRRAFTSQRSTAAFSLSPETAFWERTGAVDRRNALDSAGFPPRSSAPTSRVAPTDPCSWAGQCLPRPPEARLARPNPQAPHPAPFACVS